MGWYQLATNLLLTCYQSLVGVIFGSFNIFVKIGFGFFLGGLGVLEILVVLDFVGMSIVVKNMGKWCWNEKKCVSLQMFSVLWREGLLPVPWRGNGVLC